MPPADPSSDEPAGDRFGRVGDAIVALGAAETTEGIGEVLASTAGDLLGATAVVVYRYDGLGDELVPEVRTGSVDDPDGAEPIAAGTEPWWSAFREAETGFVRSSELVVPAGSIGIVRVSGADPGSVAQDDLDAFRTVAAATAGAVDRLHRIRSLEADREELRRENEQLRDFANIVSHDLRNPLSVAEGYLDLAVETGDEEHVQTVKDAHDRIEGIIQHTLTLARQGQRIDDATTVDLESVAERAWRAVETEDATLRVGGSLTFDADAERLQQLFENLFRNAIEHGGPAVTIRVGATDDGFYVADDGPGIDPDERSRVFERGYTDSEDGTGFGLHIVREIVEAHRWSVSVGESDDGGARFDVSGV